MFEAKLWEAFESLKLAWEKGARKVVLEMNCIEAIGFLNDQTLDESLLGERVKDICSRWRTFV